MVLDNAFFRRGEVYTNFVQRRIDLSALAPRLTAVRD
jgi:hypothetical protein